MIQISQLNIARGSKVILRDAEATLFPKEKVGLIGLNGAGKSSFLAAMLGQLQVDQGNIDIPKTWRKSWIDQEVTENELTVLDFALKGDLALHEVRRKLHAAEQSGDMDQLGSLYEEIDNLDGYTAESRVSTILHGLGFKPQDLNRKVGEFSGGWKMRLNLAKVLGSRAELILLDEPTNHLDIDAVLWLEQWIKQVDCTVIVVSHDRDFLDSICTHTLHLHGEKLTKYSGGYSSFERTFAERAEQISQQNRKASAEMQHLQKFVDRFKAKASKAKQAQSRVKRLEKISLIETLKVDNHIHIPFLEPHKSPDPLVVLNNASCGYGEQARILNHISMEIRPGDRIGLLGANGNGKTTLVRSLVGELPLVQGDRVEGKGLVYGYFAQDQIDSLDMQATPLEHLLRLDRKATEQQARSFLARYQFQDQKVKQKVDTFSGGEKSRLALALLAYQRPNLLLLDEPTNHLDIATRQALASSLLDFEGALVIVSHDRHLLESITDTYWRVAHGAVAPFEGDLEDYSELLKKESNGKTPVVRSPIEKQADGPQLKKLKSQQKKLETLAGKLQGEIASLDEQFMQVQHGKAGVHEQAAALATKRQASARQLEQTENEIIELLIEIETLETTQS